MALTSALYTGLSGLDVAQAWMQVVGNNIANVNTTAYKSSRALFQSQFYVTSTSGSAPTADSGGANPSQLGLGASVATIQKNFGQGSITSTGNDTDLAINGKGFFVLQDPSAGQEYTRDGAFTLNGSDQLVSTNGQLVQGYAVDSTGTIIPGRLDNVTIPLGSATIAKATSTVDLIGNLSADGLVSSGGSTITSQDLQLSPTAAAAAGTTVPTGTSLLTDLVSTASGNPNFTLGQTLTLNGQHGNNDIPTQTFTVGAGTTVNDLETFFNNGLGIDTSAAGTGTSLIAGTAAGSADLQVVGNSGTSNALTLVTAGFSDSSGNTPLTLATSAVNPPVGESTSTTMTAFDSLGIPVNLDITTTLASKSSSGTVWNFQVNSPDNIDNNNPGQTLVGTGTLTFDTNGQLLSSTGANITVHRDNTGALPTLPITLDFSGMSSLAQDAGNPGSTMQMSGQDGIQLGTLTSFSVGTDGTITGSFDNGQTRTLGQVAVAEFNNDQGLNDLGGNVYTSGANSGVPIITTAQSLGAGSIQSGALEQSNVDLSLEFTNLIQASTGFSASSRVITTSDQMITQLLDSSR
jgi:flagellar hook protein FlgE